MSILQKIQISDAWGIEFVDDFEPECRELEDWSVEDVINFLDYHKPFPADLVGYCASAADLQKLRDAHYIS